VLEGQSCKLHRLWTPHFSRDRQGCTDAIMKDVLDMVSGGDERDAIRVIARRNELIATLIWK
jgi:hypothetical protein